MVMQICVRGEMKTRNWQSVSSCRGRFIVPVYRKIHTKWGGEYAYLIMWKCVFGNANMILGYVRIRAR